MSQMSNEYPTIVHMDMDMFFAAVEIRDNPDLVGKPLIIGSLPSERGVVATCSYEARKYGVRSAMNIKEAYRLCPHGVYMHPNGHKYVEASRKIQAIWQDYTDLIANISLDEGFLDVTSTLGLFGSGEKIGREIKQRVYNDTGLTCSVGVGYSWMSAKLASEEKKPNGFYQILTPEQLRDLIIDRSVRIIYGIGPQTAAKLEKIGIWTVRDLYQNPDAVVRFMGSHGQHLLDLAWGIDDRKVEPSNEAKSLGKEITFQKDNKDREYLADVLRLIARELSFELRVDELYAKTITLKVSYFDLTKITRSHTGQATNHASYIAETAISLLEKVEDRAIRLVGISLSQFTKETESQLNLFQDQQLTEKEKRLDQVTMELQKRFGLDIVKSGTELESEKRVKQNHSVI